jgi:hypothetical protein
MINMRDEWYQYMRKNNMNMSEEINKYLDARFHLKICPTCYTEIIARCRCSKCDGEAIFCANLECTDYDTRVGNSCPSEMYFGKMRPQCTAEEFYGPDREPGTPEFG